MTNLETRSEVKVTLTQGWYATLYHRKMQIGISPSNNLRYAQDRTILKTSAEVKVKVTVTRKWYKTLRHPKIQQHTRDMLMTRLI